MSDYLAKRLAEIGTVEKKPRAKKPKKKSKPYRGSHMDDALFARVDAIFGPDDEMYGHKEPSNGK